MISFRTSLNQWYDLLRIFSYDKLSVNIRFNVPESSVGWSHN